MHRNEQIVSDIRDALDRGKNPIVLTERTAHAEVLTEMISKFCAETILLCGKDTAKVKRSKLEQINSMPKDKLFVIIATGKYVGEGFDCPRLDALFLTMPIAWKGTVEQYAGRLHRNYDGKQQVVIYDYVDIRVPVLERMYYKRLSGYATLGYNISTSVNLENQSVGTIFDHNNFWQSLSIDFMSAQKEIIIVSPFLNKTRTLQTLKCIEESQLSGVKVAVITRTTEDYKMVEQARIKSLIGLLKEHNVKVILKSRIHQKMSIIDSKIVWYGSVNILSYAKSEESMMRFESKEIAEQLLEDIHKFLNNID